MGPWFQGTKLSFWGRDWWWSTVGWKGTGRAGPVQTWRGDLIQWGGGRHLAFLQDITENICNCRHTKAFTWLTFYFLLNFYHYFQVRLYVFSKNTWRTYKFKFWDTFWNQVRIEKPVSFDNTFLSCYYWKTIYM